MATPTTYTLGVCRIDCLFQFQFGFGFKYFSSDLVRTSTLGLVSK